MLVFRILATVFLSISCVMCLIKNINIFSDTKHNDRLDNILVITSTAIGWSWRAFVIVAVWVI